MNPIILSDTVQEQMEIFIGFVYTLHTTRPLTCEQGMQLKSRDNHSLNRVMAATGSRT